MSDHVENHRAKTNGRKRSANQQRIPARSEPSRPLGILSMTPDNDYFAIACDMAQELRDIVDAAVEATNDHSSLSYIQDILREFDKQVRMGCLLCGAGLGGPFVRAVTRSTHSAPANGYPYDDWPSYYNDATDPGWTQPRGTVWSESIIAIGTQPTKK